MILEGFLEKVHVKSYFAKLIIGAALAALSISLASVVVLDMLGFSINNGIPAGLAAIGSATYAVRVRKGINEKTPR